MANGARPMTNGGNGGPFVRHAGLFSNGPSVFQVRLAGSRDQNRCGVFFDHRCLKHLRQRTPVRDRMRPAESVADFLVRRDAQAVKIVASSSGGSTRPSRAGHRRCPTSRSPGRRGRRRRTGQSRRRGPNGRARHRRCASASGRTRPSTRPGFHLASHGKTGLPGEPNSRDPLAASGRFAATWRWPSGCPTCRRWGRSFPSSRPVYLDQGDTGFRQPAGEKQALAEAVNAVALADRGRFLAKVEGLAGLRRTQEIKRLLGSSRGTVHRAGTVHPVEVLIDLREQRTAVVKPQRADFVRQTQLGDAEGSLGGIAVDQPRVGGTASQPASWPGQGMLPVFQMCSGS